jgi:molybdenum cofactor cytidylyltransferase
LSDRSDIAAIILAAGSSHRFGSNKLLHRVTLRGVTLPLAAHSLLPWLENFERVTVVVQPGSTAFCRAITASLKIAPAAIRWLVCSDAVYGMGASLACGVRANSPAAGWLIGLADMPAMPPAAIACVRNSLAEGAELAATCCNGKRGHPVGFASRYYAELQTLRRESGARSLVERDKANLVLTEIDNSGIHTDIDTPDDLQHLQAVQSPPVTATNQSP